jgi:hypothetical protein
MLQPRQLVEGPEYPRSLADARSEGRPRFEANLRALLYVARFTPMDSDPFLEERLRVRETRDPANGYSVALFFDVHPHRFITELKWIQIGPLDPDVSLQASAE